MRIQTNLMALNTHRQMSGNNTKLTKSTEKLSSGYRINRASDDAAGLTISEKMRAQIRGLAQASSNAQDGVSLIQAAEGALQEAHSILQRMRELAVQAANDTMESEDREAVSSELKELTKEIDRIAYTTEFNKKVLLDGSQSNNKFGRITSGTGFSAVSITQTATLGIYTVTMQTPAAAAVYSVDISQTNTDVIEGGTISIAGLYNTANSPFLYSISDQEIQSGNMSELMNNIAAKINADTESKYSASYNAGVLTLTAKEPMAVYPDNPDSNLYTPVITVEGAGITATVNSPATVTGTDATFEATAVDKAGNAITLTTASYNSSTGYVDVSSSSGVVLSLRIEELDKFSAASVKIDQGSSLTLQVGANSGSSQTLRISVDNLSAKGLGIDQLNVSNHINAQGSIDAIEAALQRVSAQRSGLGAIQNRLEHTIANIDTVGENLTNAESRIRDVDMAKEMMAQTTANILIQASTAMLAQANQSPQNVLRLLQG